jgi:TolA-binding protein
MVQRNFVILALLGIIAGSASGQTTQPASIPLAQGFLAAAEVLALRQEVATMRGRIAELEGEVQQLRKTLEAKATAEAVAKSVAKAEEAAKAAAKKAAPALAIQAAIKVHRLAIGMTLEEANKARTFPGALEREAENGEQDYRWGKWCTATFRRGKIVRYLDPADSGDSYTPHTAPMRESRFLTGVGMR